MSVTITDPASPSDAEILHAAALVMRRLGRYATGLCQRCFHAEVDHMRLPVDEKGSAFRLECVGCFTGEPCRRYLPDWRFDNQPSIAAALEHTATELQRGRKASNAPRSRR